MRLELKTKPEVVTILNQALLKADENTLYFKHQKDILYLLIGVLQNDIRGKFYWEVPEQDYVLEFRDFKFERINNLLSLGKNIEVIWNYRSFKLEDYQNKD